MKESHVSDLKKFQKEEIKSPLKKIVGGNFDNVTYDLDAIAAST